jgi:hypothetical protein
MGSKETFGHELHGFARMKKLVEAYALTFCHMPYTFCLGLWAEVPMAADVPSPSGFGPDRKRRGWLLRRHLTGTAAFGQKYIYHRLITYV